MSTLTGDEICAIIKACSEAKVYSFALGKLSISFSPAIQQDAGDTYIDYSKIPENVANIAESEKAASKSNFDKKYSAEEMSSLLLEDPQLYEELVSQRKI